ncbi:APC membrane recruitment protein 2, transcript variant X2 [Ictidomys tridecemlineatus]|uniref:APC membrane recruitment protein 2 isoform X2 n=1 Tax=Ictidomys tridecemlineatus TaxID=43179 RepID=UPI000B549183|nr:APC membrane recruitment protein 2 isoform X2 [Ictidomys tridecemlineatus]KAG3292782.1 APC membrane recruitment protein 2, transcript variant X2 [Ictidomys tridecemlineatus]
MTVAWREPTTDESCLSRSVSMETSRSSGGSGSSSEAVRELGCDRASPSAGVCRRKEEAGAGTLAADMDLHCDCAAETPAAEQPSGKINKAAFKLFKKRKSGGTMPSIFGVKNKGDGKSSGPTGMVRSRTHDGLAEVVVLEGSKKEEPRAGGDSGGGRGGGRPNPGPPRAAGTGVGSLANSSVAKSHSFFSLLKKNGRSENGKGDPAEASKAGGKQKRGLKGIFSSMRWHKKDKRGKEEEKEAHAAGQGSLILPGSLTASLECVKEETPRAACEPETPSQDAPRDPAGCGDIIADPEEEAGPSCDKHAPGPGKPVLSKKNPSVVAYQGGGEEMASPDEVDDTYLQEFWDMLSQTEEQGPGPQEGAAKAAAALETKVVPETSKDARSGEASKDVSLVKRRRLNRIPIESHPKEQPKHPEKEKEQPEGVPNSDEGYWDSTTPGPEEESASSGKKAGIPRDSYSGDALYDLYADPDGSPAVPPANEETSCLSRLKPVSPGTITCPLRTPGSLLKDSKIPISIKHLTNLPSSHPVVHQQPTRSEMPRTKIPVSKVLVRRVSNRGLAGTTIRAAACHDSAKKL